MKEFFKHVFQKIQYWFGRIIIMLSYKTVEAALLGAGIPQGFINENKTLIEFLIAFYRDDLDVILKIVDVAYRHSLNNTPSNNPPSNSPSFIP